MQTILNLLVFLFIICLILFVITLKNPKRSFNKQIFKTTSKGKLIFYYVITIIALFISIGLLGDKTPTSNIVNTNIEESDNSAQLSKLYDIIKVVDGDTIDVSIDGKTERLRLIGVDTPETVDPRKPVQCFGKEASENAKNLLVGKKVRLEKDESQDDRDKYDRLLRYVYLENGENYNKKIISEGYAREYTYDSSYKYQSEFKQSEAEASKNSRGLWSPNTCNGKTEEVEKEVTKAETIEKVKEKVKSASPQIEESKKAKTAAPTTDKQESSSSSPNCDPNYSGGCVPVVSHDLNCSDISFSVTVIGTDHHKFDRDRDGHGCENN